MSDKFGQVWTSLDKFEQVQTSSDKVGQFNLIKFQQHDSNFRSKLKIAQKCRIFSKMVDDDDDDDEKLFLRPRAKLCSRSKTYL